MRVGNQLILAPPAEEPVNKKPAKKKVKTVKELHAELFPCPHNAPKLKSEREKSKEEEESDNKPPQPLDYSERFAAVMGTQSSQAELFRVCGLPIVEATLSGRSTCLFAYGQTGSGASPSGQNSGLPHQGRAAP